MKINELKSKILTANSAYRGGNSIMTDQEFDDLCDELESMMEPLEWTVFRNSLHENTGKVKHPYIMGSLDKLKYEEPENVISFIEKYIKNGLHISKKVDGISCRLHYENGHLVSASTRGDGNLGEDLSDKIKYVKNVPLEIICDDEIDIRGELVILKSDFEKMNENGEWKNPRNATAGLVNRKEFNSVDISNISFISYTILGDKFTKHEQFSTLKKLGFKTSVSWEYPVTIVKSEIVENLHNLASREEEYECDGLVISDIDYRNEENYRPDAQKAFKINSLIAETKLIDIDFSSVSKEGKICPVGILDPIDLGGSTISRVSVYNLDFIEKNNLKYGSKVKIMKSGDIIPRIISVENIGDEIDIEYPEVCPVCGEKLERKGIDIYCVNEECPAQVSNILVNFIRKLDIKNASNASLENFNIKSYEDLLKFIPDQKYKNEVKLYNELEAKVFNNSKKNLFLALNFTGLSKINLTKVIDFYGFDFILANPSKSDLMAKGLPMGIGEITLDKFMDDLSENIKILNMFTSDPRFKDKPEEVQVKKSGISVCFTGSLNTMSRSQASKLAESVGIEVKGGVVKGLTYLVTNDKNSGSSKNKKAKELGTDIINEVEFLNLVKSEKGFDVNDL